MMAPFIQIPGPLFLLLFIGLLLVCAIFGRRLMDLDGSHQHPLPEPTRLNADRLAVLLGRRKAVIHTAICCPAAVCRARSAT